MEIRYLRYLGTWPEKLIFDKSSSILLKFADRFLPQDFKNLIKNFLRPPCRELCRHLLWTKKNRFFLELITLQCLFSVVKKNWKKSFFKNVNHMINHVENRKIIAWNTDFIKKLNMKNYVIFLIRENVNFPPKKPVFSILAHDTDPKVKNSDPMTKATFTIIVLQIVIMLKLSWYCLRKILSLFLLVRYLSIPYTPGK